MLHKLLANAAREYSNEKALNFSGSKFGNHFRKDLPAEGKKQISFRSYELELKASVGQSTWAEIPWLAFFDPLITRRATTGFYVAYLINPTSKEIILSLNQGSVSVLNEFGNTRGLKVLERRARDMSERVSDFSNLFSTSPIDLGSNAKLPSGYCAGHIFGKTYQAEEIEKVRFYDDLFAMLDAYRALVERGGATPIDEMLEQAGTKDIEEAKKYILSRRIERAPNVRNKVLNARGEVCEGCGFDPSIHLAFGSPSKKIPLDVHHCKPLNTLAEGEQRRYRIPNDFLVLCPTCHRIIHTQNDPGNLDNLKLSLNFSLIKKGIA